MRYGDGIWSWSFVIIKYNIMVIKLECEAKSMEYGMTLTDIFLLMNQDKKI